MPDMSAIAALHRLKIPRAAVPPLHCGFRPASSPASGIFLGGVAHGTTIGRYHVGAPFSAMHESFEWRLWDACRPARASSLVPSYALRTPSLRPVDDGTWQEAGEGTCRCCAAKQIR